MTASNSPHERGRTYQRFSCDETISFGPVQNTVGYDLLQDSAACGNLSLARLRLMG